MNGYIEAGYSVVLGSLAVYAGILMRRERVARARLGPGAPPSPPPASPARTAAPTPARAPGATTGQPAAAPIDVDEPAGQPDGAR